MAASVTLAEILKAHSSAEMENAHVCLPCKVLSYDTASQTVSVQPLVKRAGFTEDGETRYEALPAYPNVQVAFPRAGSFVVYLPISDGDFGHLVFCDMATGEARATGQVSEPQDVSRHAGAYCIFLPGGYPDPNKLADHPSSAYFGIDGDEAQVHTAPGSIKLGKTATDAVVLASALKGALITAVTAAVGSGGNISQGGMLTALNDPTFLTAISAAIVKAK